MKAMNRKGAVIAPEASAGVPDYLQEVYWWAYLHPTGVRIFERQWLVNLILWGHFRRLRDAALAELGPEAQGHVLQVACVYGDFTQRIVARLAPEARLTVVDVAPIQLRNLSTKLVPDARVVLQQQDSSALDLPDGSVDTVILFFLLHEQPAAVRRRTLGEACRVVKPGGKVVQVDYHRPRPWHPLRWLMAPVLRRLEPFALDLWREEISAFRPSGRGPLAERKATCCGGLYQKVVWQF